MNGKRGRGDMTMKISIRPRHFDSSDFPGFSGDANWNVGNGGTDGLIVETNSTTATGMTTIHVRYPDWSLTAGDAHTVWVECTQGGVTKRKKRTVFRADFLILNFTGPLDNDNLNEFDPDTGTDVRQCGLNWTGDHNAILCAEKMQAVLMLVPADIDWAARGVHWTYSADDDQMDHKFDCRLHRYRIAQTVGQKIGDQFRVIRPNRNDNGWVYDGDSDEDDAQNPTDTQRNFAFRIDSPYIDPFFYAQACVRADFREVLEWNNGDGWSTVTPDTDALWYVNITADPPDCSEGLPNTFGYGTADNVTNTQPVADAGSDQTVDTEEVVELNGTGSSDADSDQLTFQWIQTDGIPVDLDDETSPTPTFTAPDEAGDLVFQLIVSDICKDLHYHQPDNYESEPDTVVIHVQ